MKVKSGVRIQTDHDDQSHGQSIGRIDITNEDVDLYRGM